MSAADANELVLETQSFKPQETEGHVAVTQDRSEDVSQPEKKAPVRKEHVVLVREAGKSLLPFARVQKIIKADKEIPIVAKDATFLISLATEEFIKRLTEAGKMVAEREKRATVQHKDIATVVRRADEFLFLEEIIPWVSVDPLAKRKQRGMGAITDREQQTIHQFVINPNRADDKAVSEQADVTMNEDGTMGIQGGDSDQDDFE
ncbi:Transcriptional activator HAP5 [Termitomyces sp. J132]|nr:hypothetical protein H2248_007409 [Termitomyces sp. 'cryptogamus']KNZ73038.1 Transcriptional activator HAP5 [Termitomyces sp. J132]